MGNKDLVRVWGISLYLTVSWLAQAEPGFDAQKFRGWYDGSRPSLASPADLERARDYHYVFLKGFLSEGMPLGYFDDNIAELNRLGVPQDNISIIPSSSANSLEANQPKIRKGLRRVVDSYKQRVVLLAHSRGAVDALVFAMENPEFIRDHVEAIFFIQGAFLGTGVADYIKEEGPPISPRIPSAYRSQIMLLAGVSRRFGGAFGIDSSFSELTHSKSLPFFEKLLKDNPGASQMVSDKMYYIQGMKHPSRVSPVIRAAGYYLHYSFGHIQDKHGYWICPNDGLVPTHEQLLDGLGTSLGIFEADHTDLTNAWPISSEGKSKRQKITRAIFSAVSQPRPLGGAPVPLQVCAHFLRQNAI